MKTAEQWEAEWQKRALSVDEEAGRVGLIEVPHEKWKEEFIVFINDIQRDALKVE